MQSYPDLLLKDVSQAAARRGTPGDDAMIWATPADRTMRSKAETRHIARDVGPNVVVGLSSRELS